MSTVKGIWKCTASQIELLRRSSQCVTVISNTAYIFGGELKPREPRDNAVYAITVDDASLSDVERVQTLSAPGAPVARVGAASTALGGKSYYFGGRGGVSMKCLESKGSFDVFDATGTPPWSVVTPAKLTAVPFPEDRSYHSMTSDNDRTIYLHAGCPAQGRLNDLWAFDVSTRHWRQLASAPGNGRGGTSIAFSTSTRKLYRMNGFDGKTEQGGAVDIYDPERDRWSSVAYNPDGVNGPKPRSVSALVRIMTNAGRELLVSPFGEGAPSDLGHAGAGRMFDDIWAWDVKDETWHRVESDGQRPKARGWFGADAWAGAGGKGDKVVVHGGLHDDNQRLEDVWTLQVS